MKGGQAIGARARRESTSIKHTFRSSNRGVPARGSDSFPSPGHRFESCLTKHVNKSYPFEACRINLNQELLRGFSSWKDPAMGGHRRESPMPVPWAFC